MKVRFIKTGELMEVGALFGQRLIEQGMATAYGKDAAATVAAQDAPENAKPEKPAKQRKADDA